MPKVQTQRLQFVDGRNWGFDKSVRIHDTANLIGSIEVGENTRIDGFVTITGRVKIGRNCHIATGASIFGSGGVVIGDHCGISAGVQIFTGTDDPRSDMLGLHTENELHAYKLSGSILIGNYVVIGANSVVIPANGNVIRIDDEAVIGALTLVKGWVPARAIYGGIPGRVMGQRTPLRYAKEAHVHEGEPT